MGDIWPEDFYNNAEIHKQRVPVELNIARSPWRGFSSKDIWLRIQLKAGEGSMFVDVPPGELREMVSVAITNIAHKENE